MNDQNADARTVVGTNLDETTVDPNAGGGGTGAQTQPGTAAKSVVTKSGAKKKVTELGDFRLKKKLGKGGMGEVFLAEQKSLGRLVALKTLSRELSKKEDFVKRFQREARSMAKLHHPNAVQVFAVGSEKNVHYVAIEYIDGQSMQDWMDQLKQLSVGDAVHVTLVCAEALSVAHEQNMIHRDIKPDNILVTKNGVVKVADFGLAKAVDEDVSMTQSGTGLGTPLYMAPEQARNAKHVDQRTDIYALGATLYYMLTGELPYTGENTLELIMAKEKGKHRSARQLQPEIPERLDLMIDKMLAKDPGHRYGTCAELLDDLEKLQIANVQLSFIESAQPSRLSKSAAVRPSQANMAASKRPTIAPTSRDDAASQKNKTPKAKVEQELQWFVRHKTSEGKLTVSKMTTREVVGGIKTGKIDLQAKIKESAEGAWVPLAQKPQFTDVIAKRQVAVNAKTKTEGLRAQIAQTEVDLKKRARFRWFKNLFGSAVGGVQFVIYLAIVLGVIGGLGYAAVTYGMPMAAEYFGLEE